jgi:hypothetical protein
MRKLIIGTLVAFVAIVPVASAHRPTKQAIAGEARLAGEDAVRQSSLYQGVRRGKEPVYNIRRWQRHGRCATADIPVWLGNGSKGVTSYRTCYNLDTGHETTKWLGAVG